MDTTVIKRTPTVSSDRRPKKVRRRQPIEIKSRILKSALNAFATHGYEGASVRAIAEDAHVSISLLMYHFKSKHTLWRAALTDVMEHSVFRKLSSDPKFLQLTASEKLRMFIAQAVRMFCDYPALHRLMTLEGHQPNERLIWLCDTYLKDEFKTICSIILEAQNEGSVIPSDPAQLRLAIIAMAAVPFSVAAEYQYLSKRNPFNPAEVQGIIELINRLVFKS
jgi:AcrR family transcriptional regulator